MLKTKKSNLLSIFSSIGLGIIAIGSTTYGQSNIYPTDAYDRERPSKPVLGKWMGKIEIEGKKLPAKLEIKPLRKRGLRATFYYTNSEQEQTKLVIRGKITRDQLLLRLNVIGTNQILELFTKRILKENPKLQGFFLKTYPNSETRKVLGEIELERGKPAIQISKPI